MNIKENIRPVSDFRKDTAHILKQIKENHDPIILTQRGRSVAVILDVDTYERLEYEHRFRAAYSQGVQELKQGKGIAHRDVLKELDKKLKTIRPR